MFRKKDRLIKLPIGVIHPSNYQARVEFDTASLEALADSIKRNGLLQPITVRRREDGAYELIAGERRLRACRMAGLSEVFCIEKKVDDRRSAILGLVENLQRDDLNMFEEAEGIAQLINEWGMTQYDCAVRLGKAQSTISNKLRLLRFSRPEQQLITSANLSERHARALLRIENTRLRQEVLSRVIADKMGVFETEQAVDKILTPIEIPTRVRTAVVTDLRVYINSLSKTVESIRRSGLPAQSTKTETEDYIEYKVILPKGRK